ncbi:hypothetical protein NDU88_003289 [Pleurodeles waltl]|uniref:Uncharacterized protein n=1 Tax=Pleurodeles waltl TaxID=8319 RepID=A0AAV7LL71_PLEWA|nr:hypothetical protein NDU88_003289 [Pleurodeles waltl]
MKSEAVQSSRRAWADDPGGVHQRDPAAGGGLSRARGLLVSVCRVEPSRNFKKQEGFCPHSLLKEEL